MTLDENDPRSVDMKKLHEQGIEMAWKNAWMGHLNNSIDELKEENQKLWRISRLSFLAGYLHAHQEESKSDIGCDECGQLFGVCENCQKDFLPEHEGYCASEKGHNHFDCKNPLVKKQGDE